MTANLSRVELLEMALSEPGPAANGNETAPAAATPSVTATVRTEPQRRPEGLGEMHSFLEHRSRQWSNTLRVLEQQRMHVQSLENEREAEYKQLEAAVEAVQKAMRTLRTAADLGKDGRPASEIEKAMEANRTSLDQLETVAANLNTNFMAWRSSWQQYAQTFDASKRLRAEMDARMQSRS